MAKVIVGTTMSLDGFINVRSHVSHSKIGTVRRKRMAYYLVQAKPVQELLTELRNRLDSGEIRVMRPFGQALQYGLDNARLQEDGIAVWEEEDYCVPPLAQERAAILDTYFRDLNTKRVEQEQGWKQIESLPKMWQ